MSSANASHQALFKSLQQDVLGQVDANEHHLAHFRLACSPQGSQIAAHELVNALENDLTLGTLHVQNALVTEHARTVNVHDSAQKVL